MSDATAIVNAVRNDVTLASLIDGRIYPLVLPPITKNPTTGEVLTPILPAVTYGLVSQATSSTQESHEYRSPRWRFHVYSLSYDDLEPIARALAGRFGNPANTPFQSSRIEYPSSRAEDHESDTHRYWRALDVVVALAPAGAVAQ